ncbi:MAG TPA: inositol monophosphatase family protein [Acidothermaceae bacterium]|nr:inositol monophosphatase family protein [Acidothermaceae bacterium]
MNESSQLLELAVHAARVAGGFLVDARPADLVVHTKSTPTDVVTQMDTAAEQLIAKTIRESRPDDAMLGEEGQADDAIAGRRVRWIVDPIDGTVNYLYGLPQWAVSIAAEVGGVVVAAAVFDPSKNELFTAELGGGGRLNGVPIRVSGCTELAQALVGTGFGYDASRRARQAQVLTGVLPLVRDIRRLGAASLDLCALACGRLDGYFERGLNLWDHAAAGLIAAEAGARVEGLRGRAPDGDLLVAATPGVFDALHDLVAALGADHD